MPETPFNDEHLVLDRSESMSSMVGSRKWQCFKALWLHYGDWNLFGCCTGFTELSICKYHSSQFGISQHLCSIARESWVLNVIPFISVLTYPAPALLTQRMSLCSSPILCYTVYMFLSSLFWECSTPHCKMVLFTTLFALLTAPFPFTFFMLSPTKYTFHLFHHQSLIPVLLRESLSVPKLHVLVKNFSCVTTIIILTDTLISRKETITFYSLVMLGF